VTGGDLQRSRRRRPSGGVDRLPSGRWRARFYGPDARRVAKTFRTKADADAWIASQRVAVLEGRYVDPVAGRVSFGHFAKKWLDGRHDLRPKTRELYEGLLRRWIVPEFGDIAISRIQPGAVRDWYGRLASPDGPGRSTAAKSYRLLRTIMRVAVADELIMRSPCTIKGAGIEHAQERPVATVAEVDALSDAIGERLRLAVLLAAWCGLRRGELLGLERRDIDLEGAVLRVERTRQGLENGQVVVGPPKTDAGRRSISIPPHLVPAVADHLDRFTGRGDDAPLFTGVKGGPLRAFMLHNAWELARAAVGLDHLHFHDLRHSGNTWAATTGASTRELMVRMGHASSLAALRYQHATRDRDRAIAEALSALASAVYPARADGEMEPTGTAIEPGSLGHVRVTPTNSTAGSDTTKAPDQGEQLERATGIEPA